MSAESFVRCVREQVGKEYVWGAAGPNTFDCSGLVSYCWEKTQGEPITRSSVQQFTLGVPVDRAFEPGDLHFWDTFGPSPGHVAVDVGNGRVVHALNAERGVIESDLDANMGGPYVGSRRLFTHHDEPDPEPIPKAPRRRKRRRPRRNP